MEQRIQRVGILDTNEEIGRDLQHWLLQRGYLADIMQDASSMMDYCHQLKPAALIMEMSAHGQGCPHLVHRLRESGYTAPIVATSTQHDDALQIETLHMGADDFLQKPLEIRKLLQRLELILQQDAIKVGTKNVSAAKKLEDVLTAMENRIVSVLMDHMPDPLSREQIMWEVKRQRITPEDRAIDVYISNIRRKLKMVGSPFLIGTVRGVGFALSKE